MGQHQRRSSLTERMRNRSDQFSYYLDICSYLGFANSIVSHNFQDFEELQKISNNWNKVKVHNFDPGCIDFISDVNLMNKWQASVKATVPDIDIPVSSSPHCCPRFLAVKNIFTTAIKHVIHYGRCSRHRHRRRHHHCNWQNVVTTSVASLSPLCD